MFLKLCIVILSCTTSIVAQPCTDCWCLPKNSISKGSRKRSKRNKSSKSSKGSKSSNDSNPDTLKCPNKRKRVTLPVNNGKIGAFLGYKLQTNGEKVQSPKGCQFFPLVSLFTKTPLCHDQNEKKNDVCAFQYKNDCSTYKFCTYKSKGAATNQGAVVTHTGNCGVCSSAKDLATYFDPDLASKHSNVGSIMFSFCKACLHSLMNFLMLSSHVMIMVVMVFQRTVLTCGLKTHKLLFSLANLSFVGLMNIIYCRFSLYTE
jgi:hypothetical protein